MSTFLSNKFLQYRAIPSQPRTIEGDLFCINCGYNLRGLDYGRNCPECGQIIKRHVGLRDPLLDGDESERSAKRLGLTFASTALITAALARFGLFVSMFFVDPSIVHKVYFVLGLILSAVWIAGVWLLTTRQFLAHYAKMNWLRLTARLSALLWLPAYSLWIYASQSKVANTMAGENMLMWSVLLRGGAGIGALCFAAWLMRLAADAELDEAARRLNLAIWMLPLPTILLAGLPDQVEWIFMPIIGGIVLIWCWYVLLMGRAALGMQRHVSWSLRLSHQLRGREARIDQTRRELQRAVEATIRPVGAAPTGPAFIEDDRPCAGCGYNRRGLRIGARCPECGRSQM